MGRKKKEELPKVIFKPVPWTEEQKEAAIKRLVFIMATDMGWVPKELTRTQSVKQKPHQT